MIPERLDNLEIIHWPDPRLKIAGQKIEVFDQRLEKLARRMIEIMYQANGVGLAATQLGLDLQLFVGRSAEQMDRPEVYVNPELFDLGGKVSSEEAGSLIQKIELSGEVELETLKCKNCGGTLSSEHIQVVAGAPMVNCPYCQSAYQLTEEPKW